MKHIYAVKFETRYSGIRQWIAGDTRVIGNGDASRAVDAVRRREIKNSFEDVTKRGKPVIRRVTGFRMTGVERLTHVDY